MGGELKKISSSTGIHIFKIKGDDNDSFSASEIKDDYFQYPTSKIAALENQLSLIKK